MAAILESFRLPMAAMGVATPQEQIKSKKEAAHPGSTSEHHIYIQSKMRFEVVSGQIEAETLERLQRDFLPEEVEHIMMRSHRQMAPSGLATPAVLFVLGPSAVGKSSVEQYWERYVLGSGGRDWNDFVSG